MSTASRPDPAPPQREAIPVVLLFGPTGVGKTELLTRGFASAAEVIVADSMQIYRGMDIGTAKPDAAARASIPHHLLDLRDPDEGYSVGEFVADADRAAAEIHARGRLPIVSGGTAFYFKHFLYGLPETPRGDAALREGLRAEAAERGIAELHLELARVDPRAARRISPRDEYRILRALEVWRLSGRPLSEFTMPETLRGGYRFLVLGLTREREALYRRIDSRVDAMFERGLVEEVASLLERGYGFSDPGLRGIGYREFGEHRRSAGRDPNAGTESDSGERAGAAGAEAVGAEGPLRGAAALRSLGAGELDELRVLIRRDSRRYAKRQITFFKRLPLIEWLDAGDAEAVRSAVLRFAEARRPDSLP